MDPSSTRKRRPSPSRDILTREAPLTKRFRKLALTGDRVTKSTSPCTNSPKAPTSRLKAKLEHAGGGGAGSGGENGPYMADVSSIMELDDTPNRVYIYNIDDELSDDEHGNDVEADDNKLIFLSDIEKQMTQIPKHVLQAGQTTTSGSNGIGTSTELVLYQDPVSLSVPEEEDTVRRFVREARERIRQQQAGERGRKHTRHAEEEDASRVAPFSPDVSFSTNAVENMDMNDQAGIFAEYDPDEMDLG